MIPTLAWTPEGVRFIDQTRLPLEECYVLAANYEVVHVDIGKGEKNQDLMAKYEVPMKRGIPGLAVLDADGKLVYSQKNGEFENARALAPEDFLAFLNKWKPGAQSQ